MFFENVIKFFENVQNLIIIAILICVLCASVWHFGKLYYRASRCTKILRAAIKSVENGTALYKIETNSMPNYVSGLWNKILAHCVFVENKFGEEDVVLTKDIEEISNITYFTKGNRIFASIPGILTGLGLFGTFLGLTLGLSGLELEDPDKVKDGISQIINGASTAFVTSLVGIGFSLISLIIDKVFTYWAQKRINWLNNDILRKFNSFQYEEAILTLKNNNSFIKDNIATLAEQIGNKMQEGISLATEEMTKNISSAVEKLVDSTQSWGKQVTAGSEAALETIVSEFLDKVSASATEQRKLMEDSSQKMSMVVNNLDGIISGYTRIVDERFDRMKEESVALNEIHKKNLQEFISLQQDSLGSYKLELETVSKKFIEKQKEQAEMISKIATSCQDAANAMSEEFKQFKENLKRASNMITSQVNHFEEGCNTFVSGSELLNNFSSSIKDIGETISDIVAKTARIHEKIEIVTETLSNTYNGADELVHTANTLVSGLNDNFDRTTREQQKLFSDLSNSVEKLEQQVNDTFNSFSENITRQTDERLQEWNNQTNAFSSSMLGIVQAMRDLIVEMENAQKDKK